MRINPKRPRYGVAVAALTGVLALSACTAGDLGSSEDNASGDTTLTFLVDNGEGSVKPAEALAASFHTKEPSITIKVETRPGGSDGDNLVKTRLSTGDMTDVFMYNSGSLFQAIGPDKNLVPQQDQPWVSSLQKAFATTVTAGDKVYGAPYGGSTGGGVLYNKAVYAKLGLKVPKTWSEYMANNAKVKAAGIAPVIQTYQDTWTSQLFVLADFHNVAAADPEWATKYTENKVKYAQEPALKGFQRLQQVHDAGYLNKDFASLKFEQGLKMLADGKGSTFPMLTSTVGNIAATYPDKIKDIGFFALPGDDAASNGLTLWLPSGVYIPKTTTGDKLAAAEKFVAYIASTEGCDVVNKAYAPSGPPVLDGCKLPDTAPDAIKDLAPYVENDATVTPALEFQSPIKGPSLEQITVEVGSGLKSAAEGAASYDKDVKKQAQQLGLTGW